MRKKYIIIGILLITITLGITYAWWRWNSSNNTDVTFTIEGATITYNGGPDISGIKLIPVSSKEKGVTDNTAIYKEITASANKNMYLTLNLDLKTFPSALADKSLVWEIYKGETKIDNGNFNGLQQDDSITLFDGELINSTTSTYKLYIWIDGNQDNPSEMMNQSFVFHLNANATEEEQVTLYDKVASQADLTKTIDFSQVSSDTNGKGVYRFPGTENDTYPVYYYRGDIDNNHVKFANFCWKIVRTTDTGGVKMIYDGTPKNIYDEVTLQQNDYTMVTNDANFTWNSTDSTWDAIITDGQSHEISFTVPAGEGYNFIMTGTTGSSTGGSVTIFKDGDGVNGTGAGGGSSFSLNYEYGTLISSNVIKMTYSGSSTQENPITFKIKMVTQGDLLGNECNNTGKDTHISETDSAFNTNYNSPADVGYMYGTRYGYISATGTNLYYAPDVTYENGTYTLTSKGSYNVEQKSTISGTNLNYQHYACLNSLTSCDFVLYLFYVDGSLSYFVRLTDGKKIEDAISEMLTNSSNANNSTIKTAIDTWYQNNMTSYTNKLEDTVFCNDRSIHSLGSFNPDGGVINQSLIFSGYNRLYTTHQPNLTCTNKNDSFTVNESNTGNGKLTYPVGLLTSDETMLSGMVGGGGYGTWKNYLHNNSNWWFGTPSYYIDSYDNKASEFLFNQVGLRSDTVNDSTGVRPAISLKHGMKIKSGDGSSIKPYVIN